MLLFQLNIFYLFIYLFICCRCPYVVVVVAVCILACFGTNFAAFSSSLDSFENANVENIVDYMKEIRFALDYNLFFCFISSCQSIDRDFWTD